MPRAIYTKYWRGSGKDFRRCQNIQLEKVVADLREYKKMGHKLIPPDEINLLIRRYAGTKNWNLRAKEGYFRYWYKILIGRGYISENTGGFGFFLEDKLLKEGK